MYKRQLEWSKDEHVHADAVWSERERRLTRRVDDPRSAGDIAVPPEGVGPSCTGGGDDDDRAGTSTTHRSRRRAKHVERHMEGIVDRGVPSVEIG